MKGRSLESQISASVSSALIGLKPPAKTRILVVDDERTNVEVLKRYLSREGYEVDVAYDGAEALASVDQSPPDLILLDIIMPVMDGLAVCRHLRSDFTTRSIPIIFLTARNELEDRLNGLRAGVDDYIAKPFELVEVKARVECAIERRQWDLASHPLTRLPGNPSIEKEVRKRLRIGNHFAFAYIDVDNFKAYNDVYDYEAGDRVIKDLASLLIGAVKSEPGEGAFAGHIGGDDFVFLSTLDHMKRAMPLIADAFDAGRSRHYSPLDVDRAAIQTKDRQGQVKRFPLMTLSVAIVSTATRRILHYARLVEIANELKRFIKSQPHEGKSIVLWDRRKDPDERNSHA